MSEAVIEVHNLGKRYRIGARYRKPTSFAGSMRTLLLSPFDYLRSSLREATEEETLWALRDVSFEVRAGEVLGIIGRNGAGKSTLLKILSRVTEPTTGEANIYGRVGSLLEVGTGFHMELTGRENVYMNGAILGMSRAEIDRKFDEIVDFSGVEKFIDTPVKRYSSGMTVRLAFAVAAHLDPEVLIIDEVLAVGDAAFQQKCMGKMGEVAGEGRTILLVSHNMASIEALSHRAMLFEQGQLIYSGTPKETIDRYLKRDALAASADIDLAAHPNRANGSQPVFRRLRLVRADGSGSTNFLLGEPITFEIELDTGGVRYPTPLISLSIEKRGATICTLGTRHMVADTFDVQGRMCLRCTWDPGWLAPGSYNIGRLAFKPFSRGERIDTIENAGSFEIQPRDVYGTGKLSPADAILVPKGHWEFQSLTAERVHVDRVLA